jgi:hypothetical protein
LIVAVNHNLDRKSFADKFSKLAAQALAAPRKNAVIGARKQSPGEPRFMKK